MKNLLARRRAAFLKRCSKYLRYVFNDHFVLFLMFLIGLIAVQYSQLLRNFPTNHGFVDLFLALISLYLPLTGRIATYVEAPDKLFVLAKEEDLLAQLKFSTRRSFIFWGAIQTAVLIFTLPLFLAVGVPLWAFLILVLVLLVVKYLIFKGREKSFLQAGGLRWDDLIDYEGARQQRILQFFALFTHVKGLSTGVKRRSYADFLLGYLPKNHTHTWKNLYARAWLRSGDYLALTVRLVVLALLMLVMVEPSYLATGLVALFNYLLLFQLVGLYKAYDYQVMTRLFPLDNDLKRQHLNRLISQVMYVILVLETGVGGLFVADKTALFLPLMTGLVLNQFYLPYKVKQIAGN